MTVDPYDQTIERYLSDPLGDKTRKARRLLMGLLGVGLFVWLSGITPERIPLLGIEFRVVHQIALTRTLAAFITYQTLIFAIYAWQDVEKHRAMARKPAGCPCLSVRVRNRATGGCRLRPGRPAVVRVGTSD